MTHLELSCWSTSTKEQFAQGQQCVHKTRLRHKQQIGPPCRQGFSKPSNTPNWGLRPRLFKIVRSQV
ncbi:hypothetical protein CGRA01v4_14663 [Colletotrichum graminicola]|nr:hypothetical protein CGRA01v4_14663 [Colletotrichum graminicola]